MNWLKKLFGIPLEAAKPTSIIKEQLPPSEKPISKDATAELTRIEDIGLKNPKADTMKLFSLANGVQLEMVFISPGQFKAENNVTINITKGFWLGKYPVTQEQWAGVTGKNPSKCSSAGPKAPVDNVSWIDCQSFISTVNKTMGLRYRLPTEAEWEYACRAGTTTQLNNGKEITSISGHCPNLDEVGWNGGGWKDQIVSSQPVGQKKPNAWGLYDMHGNVWEWCADWDGAYPPTSNVENPTGPSSGEYRVIRGGSWYSTPNMFGSSRRDSIQPDYTSNDTGVRLAMTDSIGDD